MSDFRSPYYPPRARWNRHLHHLVYGARRQLHLNDLRLPIQTTPLRFLLSFAVPGFSFLDAGWKVIATAMMLGWGLAACAFLAFLGYTPANIAFGLMMSLHVSSILFVLNRIAPGMPVLRRLVLSIAIL